MAARRIAASTGADGGARHERGSLSKARNTTSVRELRGDDEIELVAERMRRTLVEVLGARGDSLYTPDWLVRRVRWHLASEVAAEVFAATDADDRLTGHVIVRVALDETARKVGLVSTIYVEPDQRRRGVARALIERGERWMGGRGLRQAMTLTHEGNTKLHRLFTGLGYTLTSAPDDFVKLAKCLAERPAGESGERLVQLESSPWSYALFREEDGTHWLFVSCDSDDAADDLDRGILRIAAADAARLMRADPEWARKAAVDIKRDPGRYLNRDAAARFHRLRD